jgi:hypothetical protein
MLHNFAIQFDQPAEDYLKEKIFPSLLPAIEALLKAMKNEETRSHNDQSPRILESQHLASPLPVPPQSKARSRPANSVASAVR